MSDTNGGKQVAGLSPAEAAEGFVPLFDGKTFEGWDGGLRGYSIQDGVLICRWCAGGRIHTVREYSDFVLRLDLMLCDGAENGIGLLVPPGWCHHPSYEGVRIQIADDSSEKHGSRPRYHQHGAIYGVIEAAAGHLQPQGHWNEQEILCRGSRIRVTLNRAVILDVHMDTLGDEHPDEFEHPGLKRRSGTIDLLGGSDEVKFRNMRIREQ